MQVAGDFRARGKNTHRDNCTRSARDTQTIFCFTMTERHRRWYERKQRSSSCVFTDFM